MYILKLSKSNTIRVIFSFDFFLLNKKKKKKTRCRLDFWNRYLWNAKYNYCWSYDEQPYEFSISICFIGQYAAYQSARFRRSTELYDCYGRIVGSYRRRLAHEPSNYWFPNKTYRTKYLRAYRVLEIARPCESPKETRRNRAQSSETVFETALNLPVLSRLIWEYG